MIPDLLCFKCRSTMVSQAGEKQKFLVVGRMVGLSDNQDETILVVAALVHKCPTCQHEVLVSISEAIPLTKPTLDRLAAVFEIVEAKSLPVEAPSLGKETANVPS